MKTNMLIISLMISGAAAAQTSIQATGTAQSELTLKKNQAALSSAQTANQETLVKNNKINTGTSLEQQAELTRTGTAGPQSSDHQYSTPIKAKAGETLSGVAKEKSALTASAAKLVVEKQAKSKEMANAGIKTSEKLGGVAQSQASATVKAVAASRSSVQQSAKTGIASVHSTSVKNLRMVKTAVKPRPIRINTQIKSVAVLRIR